MPLSVLCVALMVLTPLVVHAGPPEPPRVKVSEIVYSLQDERSDHTSSVVQLFGLVTLGQAMAGGDYQPYMQDETGGIALLAGAEHSKIVYGDSIRVFGTPEMGVSGPRLRVESIHVLGAHAESEPPAAKLSGSDARVRRLVGSIVALEGEILDLGDDERGRFLLIDHPLGPVSVRTFNIKENPVVVKAEIGDYVRATGILAAGAPSSESGYEILTRRVEDLAVPIIPRPMLPWVIGPVITLAVVGLLMLTRRMTRRASRASRRPYQAIFEQAGNAMVLGDENLKIIDANEAACSLLGQSYTQLRLRRLMQILKIDEGYDLSMLSEKLSTGVAESFAASLWGDTDDNIYLDVTISRISHRGKDHVLAVLHDVSRHTESVQQFKLFHEELLDGVPVEVGVMSPSGKYLYVNRYVAETEETQSWILGKTDLELCQKLGLESDIALRRRAHRKRAVSKRESTTFEEVIEVGGEKHVVQRIYQPLLESSDGEVAAVATYGIDITELKTMREQLTTARGEVDSVGRLKEGFLENIDHEFRKPITGIIGFAEILQGEVSDEQREFVNLIERNGRRLMNTLNAVLDLAGLSSNEFDLNLKVLNVVEEVSEVLEESRSGAAEKGLFLKLESSRPNVLVRADEACLARVIQNLVDNSVKTTEKGGVVVEVESDDEAVYVRVLDTGRGIGTDHLPVSLDEEALAVGPIGGMERVGIGLGVTKRLVELMNGTIKIESEKGEGNIFSVTLPRAFPKESREGGGLPRLLLGDDSEDVHAMVRYVVQDHLQVEMARDIESVYRMVKRSNFDVIIVDVAIEGQQAVRQLVDTIRSRNYNKHVPIILTDEHGRLSDDQLAAGDRFVYRLQKPFKRSDLMNVLSRALAERFTVRIDDKDDEPAGEPSEVYRKAS
jgi:PAS domain S-box-containing protein